MLLLPGRGDTAPAGGAAGVAAAADVADLRKLSKETDMLTRNLMLFLLTIYALIVVAALWERRWPRNGRIRRMICTGKECCDGYGIGKKSDARATEWEQAG